VRGPSVLGATMPMATAYSVPPRKKEKGGVEEWFTEKLGALAWLMSTPSEYSGHLRWLMTMAVAMSSVFALNSLVVPTTSSKWLWMLQAFTPFVTFSVLGQLDAGIRPSSGNNIGVMTILGSVVSVPVLLILYGILIALGALAGVFYIALFAKVVLWLVGHNCVLHAQLEMRCRRHQGQELWRD